VGSVLLWSHVTKHKGKAESFKLSLNNVAIFQKKNIYRNKNVWSPQLGKFLIPVIK
jgi:hypothetical protein